MDDERQLSVAQDGRKPVEIKEALKNVQGSLTDIGRIKLGGG